jgi:hypothetical protein
MTASASTIAAELLRRAADRLRADWPDEALACEMAAHRAGRQGAGRPSRAGIDWDAELIRAQADAESDAALAARLGMSREAVRRAARNRGVRLVGGVRDQNRRARGIDWPAELARAQAAGETRADIARRLGVTAPSVGYALRVHRVPLPDGRARGRGIHWAALVAEAVQRGECAADLARRAGVSGTCARKALSKQGVRLPHGRDVRRVDWPGELVRAVAAGETQKMLAARLGVTTAWVSKMSVVHGVKLRNGNLGKKRPMPAGRRRDAAAEPQALAPVPAPVPAPVLPPLALLPAAPAPSVPSWAGPAWRAYAKAVEAGVWPAMIAAPKSEAEARLGLEAAVLAMRGRLDRRFAA